MGGNWNSSSCSSRCGGWCAGCCLLGHPEHCRSYSVPQVLLSCLVPISGFLAHFRSRNYVLPLNKLIGISHHSPVSDSAMGKWKFTSMSSAAGHMLLPGGKITRTKLQISPFIWISVFLPFSWNWTFLDENTNQSSRRNHDLFSVYIFEVLRWILYSYINKPFNNFERIIISILLIKRLQLREIFVTCTRSPTW